MAGKESNIPRLKHILRMYALYARMDFNWLTQDTKICITIVLSEIFSTAASISGIALLAARFNGVGGMTTDEVLFMLGYYMLSGGLSYMLFGQFNVSNISRRVGRGQVDHMLIQPQPLLMQLFTEGFMPVTGSSGFIAGAALLFYSIPRAQVAISPGWIALFILLLISKTALTLGIQYLAGAAAFYRPVACEEASAIVSDLLHSLGKFPLAGLPAWLTGALITVVPAGLMAYVPSLLLLSKPTEAYYAALPVAVAAVFVTLATIAFKKGLKYYATYGSGRYRDMGHRN